MDLNISEFFSYLISRKNLYGRVANGMQRIAVPGLGTFAVGLKGSRICFFYDPDFLKAISLPFALFVLEHEILHIILDHIPRFYELLAMYHDELQRKKAGIVFNIGADCADNTLLRNHNFFEDANIEFRAYLQAKNPDVPLDDKAGMVLPETYDLDEDGSFEYYMHELMAQVKEDDKNGEGDLFQQLAEAFEKGVNGSHDMWLPQPRKDGEDGKDGEAPTAGDIRTMLPQELEGLAQQIRAQLKQLLKTAVKEHEQSRGTIPGEIAEILADYLADPIIPWWQVLTTRVTATKRSKPYRGISRPNRMLVAMAEEDASIIPSIGRTRDPKFRVFFYVDTSGSMHTESLAIARSELSHLLSCDEDMEVRYMQGDTETHFDQVFKTGETLPREAEGRGGTEFEEYFRYMGKYLGNPETEPDLVIVYTDGFAPMIPMDARLPPDLPVIWLLTPAHSKDHLMGYGEVIVCDPKHNEERDDE